MMIQFTGHNTEVTPALREFATNKLDRLKRFSEMISNIHVIFNVDKTRQIAEAVIKMHGKEILARSESHDMYTAIDELIDKIMRQLNKIKEKHHDRR